MNVLMPMYKIWADKILSGDKPMEFRSIVAKKACIGDKIYIYESSKYNGCKMVVGEVTIKDIVKLKPTKLGCYNFMHYYLKNIKKDYDLLNKFEQIDKIELKHYNRSWKLNYLYMPEKLEEFAKTEEFDLLSISQKEREDYLKKTSQADLILRECDDWLIDMGFYNDQSESYYNYYYELENPIRYSTPKEITSFINQQGNPIIKAPQSWCYAQKGV